MATPKPDEPTSALVLGGGVAGLLAAAVSLLHFDRVCLVEQDDLSGRVEDESIIQVHAVGGLQAADIGFRRHARWWYCSVVQQCHTTPPSARQPMRKPPGGAQGCCRRRTLMPCCSAA